MAKDTTMTIQELRRDPVGFLRQVNRGKTMTIIYKSKPFAVVTSGEKKVAHGAKSIERMLEYAELARNSAKTPLESNLDYKKAYDQDLTKKYDLS